MSSKVLLYLGRGWIALAYGFWALFALVSPVTVFDANTYNLARLPLALRHGLFGNPAWNTFRQVCWPWTFDAVHLPFLALGAGTSLPSFACFTGILAITYRLVRDRAGALAATWSCAGLLALPTLLFQATSCKNDIPVAFAVFAWYFALDCYRAQGRPLYLAFVALSLGFAAGAKTSGIPLAIVLAAWSGWTLRRSQADLVRFGSLLIAAFAAFGSLETYINNGKLYHHAMGPPDYIASLTNHDGLRGGVANFVRYLFGFADFGVGPPRYSGIEQWVTGHLGCANAGLTPHQSEADIRIADDGWEASSSFGPLGAAAIALALIAPFLTARAPLRRLCLASIASLGLVCLTTDWMPWNNRFLLLPVALATIALAVAAFSPPSRWASAAFVLLVAYSGVVIPCQSYNKNPRGLWMAVFHRQTYTYRERLTMQPVVADLRRRVAARDLPDLTLCAGPDSWVLPILELPGVCVDPEPDQSRLTLHTGSYILFLNQQPDPAVRAQLQLVEAYPEPDSALFHCRGAPTAGRE